jgi:hypothetical protein
VVKEVKDNALYQTVRAAFVNVTDGRLPATQERAMSTLLKSLWSPKTMQAELQVAVGRFLIRTGGLSPNQIRYACRVAPSWWVRTQLISAVDSSALGRTTIEKIVGFGVKDRGRDPALAAAWKSYEVPHVPPGSRKTWNKSGELLMKEIGLISRSTAIYCGVGHAFGKLDARIPTVNWKRLFRANHSNAERQAIETVAASGTNITNFVNLLDVFDDWLLDALFRTDGTIGGYTLGKIGSALSGPTCRFAVKYPRTYELTKEVHARRYESMASHPLIKRSGKPTKRISYAFLPKAKRMLIAAVQELRTAGVA